MQIFSVLTTFWYFRPNLLTPMGQREVIARFCFYKLIVHEITTRFLRKIEIFAHAYEDIWLQVCKAPRKNTIAYTRSQITSKNPIWCERAESVTFLMTIYDQWSEIGLYDENMEKGQDSHWSPFLLDNSGNIQWGEISLITSISDFGLMALRSRLVIYLLPSSQ